MFRKLDPTSEIGKQLYQFLEEKNISNDKKQKDEKTRENMGPLY